MIVVYRIYIICGELVSCNYPACNKAPKLQEIYTLDTPTFLVDVEVVLKTPKTELGVKRRI